MSGYAETGYWASGYAEGDGAQAAVVQRGDDAGGRAYYTGEAKRAFYAEYLDDLESEIDKAPKSRAREAKTKRLRKKIKAIAVDGPEPIFETFDDELLPVLAQFEAREIDWQTLSALVSAQIEQARAEIRRRRHKHIAIAMLMAA